MARGLMPAEAVVEHGPRVAVRRPSPCGRFLGAGFDQLGGLCLVAAPRRENRRGVHERRIAGGLGDRARFVEQQRSRSQFARKHVTPRQEAERELQMRERARVASDLNLAGGEQMHSFVVPELERDHVAVSTAREQEPPADVPGGDVGREQKLERPGERRCGGGESLNQTGRECIQHHVDRPCRNRARLRGPCGSRDRRSAADDFDVARHGAAEGLEVGLAGELRAKWLEAARGAQEEAAGVSGAPLLQRDLGSQKVDTGIAKFVERPGVDSCQQRKRSLEIACISLGGGGCEQAPRAMRRLGREGGGALKKGGASREPTARLRPSSGALERGSQLLVRRGRCLCTVPGTTIPIELRLDCLRQRAMNLSSLARLGRAVHRGPDERMTERHSTGERQQALSFEGARGHLGNPELLRGAPQKHRVAERLCGRQ
jgi:hypothetical protein